MTITQGSARRTGAHKAALQAAMVAIRRARFQQNTLRISALVDKLRREYPGCSAASPDIKAEIARLAEAENVPVMPD